MDQYEFFSAAKPVMRVPKEVRSVAIQSVYCNISQHKPETIKLLDLCPAAPRSNVVSCASTLTEIVESIVVIDLLVSPVDIGF